VLGALFPLVCPGCGRPGDPVCGACAERLRPAGWAPTPPGLDGWWAAFAYDGVAREVVARVKYRGARAAVPWLAEAMILALPVPGPEVDAVTWAPTSRERRRARGFDPAELLARAVARRLRARAVGMLDRRPGPPQTGRTGTDRRHGPAHVARRVAPPSVLVVDDVATTGATLVAAARALRGAGAQHVVALTAARTPAPGTHASSRS
jgi:predicted amidophosphoribosyltransferase